MINGIFLAHRYNAVGGFDVMSGQEAADGHEKGTLQEKEVIVITIPTKMILEIFYPF
jgi:hypothetical protein